MSSIPILSFKDLFDSATALFSLYFSSSTSVSKPRPVHTPPGPDILNLISDSVTFDAQPTRSLAGFPFIHMRREQDHSRQDHSKPRLDAQRLEDRCQSLEKTLKETRELLRLRDVEIDKLKKAREKDRLTPERRRSDLGPQHTSSSLSRELHSRQSSLEFPIRRPSGRRSTTPPTSSLANGHINGISSRRTERERAFTLVGSQEERARIRADEIYLTRADNWSGSQVLQAIRDINSEILQFAASATDLCTFDRDSRPSSSRSVQAMHDTSSRLGGNLARILSNRDHSQDPILVQLALQGCVSICIIRALASFCIGFSAKADSVLSQLYSKMVLTEPQPTSSRWRALTHRYIRASNPNLAENSISDLSDTILRWSADIFIIAGCSSYESSTSSSKDGLRLRFGDQIRRIAKAAIRLAQVMREDIMSTSFEVVAVTANEAYDPNQMSDVFGDYVASRGAIIATTELGLKCTTRLSNTECTDTPDGVPLQKRMILRPKVVLESVLDALDPR